MASIIVKYRITGLSPLLQHNPASMGRSDGGVGVRKIPTAEQEAKAGLYIDEDGHYYINTDSFRSAIIGKVGSASGRRIGKRSAISCTSAAFFLIKERAVLVHPKTRKP